MLVLAMTNITGLVLFAAVYGVAAARVLSPTASQLALVLIFLLVTWLWVRMEHRHVRLDPVRRLGRVAAGLVLSILASVVAVLTPLFWLETVLPPDAGLATILGPTMTVLLASLALVVVVNLAGGIVATARSLRRRVSIGRRPR
jgi:hypothetical protein